MHGECWKLVRDGIGREIAAGGGEARRVGPGELEEWLLAKILEEAGELARSGDPVEAADLLEALLAWARLRGLTLDDLLRIAEAKRAEKGGFEEGYIARVAGCPGGGDELSSQSE